MIKDDTRFMGYPNRIWNSITYELSLEREEYHRQVYNTLDFLGDLGGLFSALAACGYIFILIFQFRGANMFLMNTMIPKDGENEQEEDINTQDKYYSQWSCCRKSYVNLRVRCPRNVVNRCCTCLKMNRRDRILYNNNLCQLEKEIHITHIVKTLRTLKAAVR